MRIISWITFLACAAALCGCRAQSGTPDFQPDAGEFDAAVEDDAGPGNLCGSDAPDPFNNAYSPYAGGEESVDLEIVDFAYFRCHICVEFAAAWKEIWERREDIRARVRIYYHHFPLSDEDGWLVHAASVAAANQGMENFWAVHDYIYETYANESLELGPAAVRTYCDEVLHLDMAQFDEDVAAAETMAFLDWDKGQGLAVGVTGTPSVFVCGEKVNWHNLEEIIDSYLDE